MGVGVGPRSALHLAGVDPAEVDLSLKPGTGFSLLKQNASEHVRWGECQSNNPILAPNRVY